MICNIIEESTRNQADLDIKWSIFTVIMPKVVIYRIQADSFLNFNSISAFILLQSENISSTNGCVDEIFCLTACYTKNYWHQIIWLQAYQEAEIEKSKSKDTRGHLGSI